MLNTSSISIVKLTGCLDALFKLKMPTMIHGVPGCGKSSVVKQFAKEHNLKLIDIRISQVEASDIRGIPFIDEQTKTTIWFTPGFFPTKESLAKEGFDGGIIFLDEMNLAEGRIQSA